MQKTRSESVTDRLWLSFTAIYGTDKVLRMWTHLADPDDPADRQKADRERAIGAFKRVWGQALDRFHNDVIAKAVQDLSVDGSEFPPSLSKFAKMCVDAESRLKNHRTMLALPAPSDVAPSDSPARQEFRAEMKRFLRQHS